MVPPLWLHCRIDLLWFFLPSWRLKISILILSLFHKSQILKCITYSCLVKTCTHLSSGSLQLPQSQHCAIIEDLDLFHALFFVNCGLNRNLWDFKKWCTLSLGLHKTVCSLMFSNKSLTPSQNSCIYIEAKLHTGWLYQISSKFLALSYL